MFFILNLILQFLYFATYPFIAVQNIFLQLGQTLLDKLALVSVVYKIMSTAIFAHKVQKFVLFGHLLVPGSHHLLVDLFLRFFCHDFFLISRNQHVLLERFGLEEIQVVGDDSELVVKKFEIVD